MRAVALFVAARIAPARTPGCGRPHRLWLRLSRFASRVAVAALLLALGGGLGAGTAQAQVPDTTASDTTVVRPDTTVADTTVADTTVTDTTVADTAAAGRRLPPQARGGRPDSVRVPLTPVAFPPSVYGRPALDSLPARTPAPDAADLLTGVPGTFFYDLGPDSWPDGWSLRGWDPAAPDLLLDGLPYTDPVTGRPRFDLLPPALLQRPRIGAGVRGRPVAVHARIRRFDVDRPLTDLRYRTHTNGLQRIDAVHAQQRRLRLGRPGLLQAVLGYGGRTTSGSYPNSNMRAERHLYGRVLYRTGAWSAQVRHLYTRRNLGAHGGVVPQGSFATVYSPFGASVRQSDARRQTIRNDLVATVRAPLVPTLRAPATVTAGWTAQSLRFFGSGAADTLDATTRSFHARLQQTARLGAHRLSVEARGSLDRRLPAGADTSALPALPPRYRGHVVVRDSVALLSAGAAGVGVTAQAGLHAEGRALYPSGQVRLDGTALGARLFGSVRLGGRPLTWVEQYGFGPLVRGLRERGVEAPSVRRTVEARVGGAVALGPFAFRLEGFAHQEERPVALFADPRSAQNPSLFSATATDTLTVRTAADPQRWVGAAATLEWRSDAQRGLYATVRAVAQQALPPTPRFSSGPQPLTLRGTLPRWSGRARLGGRFRLFRDLEVDAYLRGRFWGRMASRWFHPPTALFAAPPNGARLFGPNGTVDVQVEALLQGARLFLAYEHFLPVANTPAFQLQPGALVVPVYPLPSGQLRFGVHWPIRN